MRAASAAALGRVRGANAFFETSRGGSFKISVNRLDYRTVSPRTRGAIGVGYTIVAKCSLALCTGATATPMSQPEDDGRGAANDYRLGGE